MTGMPRSLADIDDVKVVLVRFGSRSDCYYAGTDTKLHLGLVLPLQTPQDFPAAWYAVQDAQTLSPFDCPKAAALALLELHRLRLLQESKS
jgi:hypothetical protein